MSAAEIGVTLDRSLPPFTHPTVAVRPAIEDLNGYRAGPGTSAMNEEARPATTHLSRRQLLAGAGAVSALAAVGPRARAVGAADPAYEPTAFTGSARLLGQGGKPTGMSALAGLARRYGEGQPLMFVDLAAVDRNASVIQNFADRQNWNVRPALKAFQCPQLCAYIMRQLPKPRGLVFRLRQVDQIMTAAPAGTDLMMGYPSTGGELRWFLGSQPPSRQRSYTLAILASSLENIDDLAGLARTTPRELPLNIALEFDSGEGRGGFVRAGDLGGDQVAASCQAPPAPQSDTLLRRLGDVDRRSELPPFRRQHGKRLVQKVPRATRGRGWRPLQPQDAHPQWPSQLQLPKLGGQARNQRDQPGIRVHVCRLSPDVRQPRARPCGYACSPVLKDIGPYPSELITQIPQPPITGHAWYLLGSAWPDSSGTQPAFIYPPGVVDDMRAGGRAAIVAPNGALSINDYVLLWPNQSGEGVDYFGSLHAVRNGRLLDVWPTFERPTDLQ